jgi:hypothetical protein
VVISKVILMLSVVSFAAPLGCSSKASPSKDSSPAATGSASSLASIVSKEIGGTPPGALATSEERKKAALSWLRYYEQVARPAQSPDFILMARLSYPLDRDFAASKLANAEASLDNSFDADRASALIVELERQGHTDRATLLASRLKRSPLPEDESNVRAAIALVDTINGDSRAAMSRIVVFDRWKADANLSAYLDNLASLGKVDAFHAALDARVGFSKTRIWALKALADSLGANDKDQVFALAKRLDAALKEPDNETSPDALGRGDVARSNAVAEAALIDALVRVGAMDEAERRLGDILRFPSEYAPIILDKAQRERLVERDKSRVGSTDPDARPLMISTDACTIARNLSAVDPEAARAMFAEAERPPNHCNDGFNSASEHFAIADQQRLVRLWESDHKFALAVLISTIVDRTDVPLDRAVLSKVEAKLTK